MDLHKIEQMCPEKKNSFHTHLILLVIILISITHESHLRESREPRIKRLQLRWIRTQRGHKK